MVSAKAITKALKTVRGNSGKRNFLQSVELVVNLKGMDMKKPENRINEELALPAGRGKDARIALIASGELALQGKKLVDKVITKKDLEELGKERKAAKKLAEEHDFFIAQADLMVQVGKYLGPVLGPRGKMPKAVPPSANLEPMVKRLKRTVRIKTKETPIIQLPVGVEDMEDKKLTENIEAALSDMEGKLEKGADNIKSIYLKTTMGPSVKLEA